MASQRQGSSPPGILRSFLAAGAPLASTRKLRRLGSLELFRPSAMMQPSQSNIIENRCPSLQCWNKKFALLFSVARCASTLCFFEAARRSTFPQVGQSQLVLRSLSRHVGPLVVCSGTSMAVATTEVAIAMSMTDASKLL